jgi:hypothetical protein
VETDAVKSRYNINETFKTANVPSIAFISARFPVRHLSIKTYNCFDHWRQPNICCPGKFVSLCPLCYAGVTS